MAGSVGLAGTGTLRGIKVTHGTVADTLPAVGLVGGLFPAPVSRPDDGDQIVAADAGRMPP
ncbi:MAG TPA: hypothetical protein VGX71_23825 [Pseudaminobacter sp.]|nr:hypothetical protein [Pseudaminobacter sp.]